ncbi:MAG: acetolactate decarboxylase [Methanomicrobiaceae archaeon]|nr:acetolactate decarboxylase [Methanomicrobiaceae archaeon]
MEGWKCYLGIGLALVLGVLASSVYFQYAGDDAAAPIDRETLYQVSTIDALLQGVFGGVLPSGDLKAHGDFGIGTFDALDGEMIVLEGTVYHATADGEIREAPDSLTTPLATVTYFDRDFAITTGVPMNITTFGSAMTDQLPTRNMVYAVRMHDTFPSMKVRAIPAQSEPYPTLAEAAMEQVVHMYTNTTGTVVGFYGPIFFKGLNVPGFHLHYLSDDLQKGGHILDLVVPAGATVEYDITPEFTMLLPTSGPFTGVDLSQDLTEELERIEK